jgi:hypothetical protein
MNPLKYWTPDEFEISSFKYNLNGRKGNSFKTSGSDNTGLCTYTYNELGFRGDSIQTTGFKIMSIGCSLTEGVGVNDNETWSYQFTKLIPNGVNLNFGCGGRSNDYICRALLSYYDLIKPDLVLIMYTSPQRREIYTSEGGIEPFIPTLSWGYMEETEDGKRIQECFFDLQNDNVDFINWYKNHQIIKLFLESKNCNWFWNGSFEIPQQYKEFNRFDGNYMTQPYSDLGVDGTHPGPLHNKVYADELFNYIKSNFPNYLPTDNQTYNNKII